MKFVVSGRSGAWQSTERLLKMGAPHHHKLLHFDAFSVDLEAAQITCKDGVVEVEPQVFDVIALLATNPGRLISYDEIIEKVWRGRIVSDSAIATRINAARRALGDDGTAQRVIKTIRGRGVRFELKPTNGVETSPQPARVAAATERELFVLSCTPHAFSLIMKDRSGDVREDWREALVPIFGAVASRCNGRVDRPTSAAFESCVDAINCARELLKAIDDHCRRLPSAERWTVKIGIAFGTLNHGFAYALASRLDAMAHPRGVCMTKYVRDSAAGALDIDVAATGTEDPQDGASVFKLTRIGDLTLVPAQGVRAPQLFNLDIPEPNEIAVTVLPFAIVGQDDELDQVAQGLRLEIHNAFARLSGVAPMAAASQAAFAGASSPEAAERLGLRYVLQGNVRAIGRRVRVMLELYDHRLGGSKWSEAYEGSLDEGFAFQDIITKRVVRELDVQVLSGEQARIWHKTLGSLKGVQLQYRGMRDFFRMDRECMRSARESFERLHQLHPDVATGANWITICHWFELQRGWTDSPERSSQAVKHWAQIAGAMEDCDGQAHTAQCHVHLLNREFDEAMAAGERAIAIRPSCATANGFYAHTLYYCGLLDNAIHHARLAIRFTPVYPPLFTAVLSGALHARGDHDAAIAIAKDSVRLNQNDGHAKLILCSALMACGREAEALAVAVELKRMEPDFLPIPFLNRLAFKDETMREQLALNCSRAILNAG